VPSGRLEFPDDARVDHRPVGHDLVRDRSEATRTSEEPPCARRIPAPRDHHVDQLTVLIHRAIQVGPPAGDLDVRLVNEPPPTGSVPGQTGGVDELRREGLGVYRQTGELLAGARKRRALSQETLAATLRVKQPLGCRRGLG
jgi:hypothetical protein